MITQTQILSALENIYISPLENCNLNCKLCYTHKTKNVLTNQQILIFIEKYDEALRNQCFFSTLNLATDSPEKKNVDKKRESYLKSILFCGGEVFILPKFTNLVNDLIQKNIFITVITNGTIDKLDQIKSPQNCQLLVSLDGPELIHDQNRGSGSFQKSISFIHKAISLGFPVEIMFLITPDSYDYKDTFSAYLKDLLGIEIKLNYITQKTIFYTQNHPLSNQNNQNPALTPAQIVDIKTNYNSVPSKNFGCFQISLQSDGQIYGCCESPVSLGKTNDDPQVYIQKFIDSLSPCQNCKFGADNVFFSAQSSERSEGASTKKSLSSQLQCNGCCCPNFLCGYKKELNQISCKDVIKLFNK